MYTITDSGLATLVKYILANIDYSYDGHKIAAIKKLREIVPIDLVHAKRLVEEFMPTPQLTDAERVARIMNDLKTTPF